MKRIILLPICIVLVVGVVYGQDNNAAGQVGPASWQRYTVKGEEFSIKFPTLPAMATYKQSGNYQKDW
ncbi:MAG TPA: hypothetical protein VE931_06540, partial [Pyrinomonadaceae bacterium]|nr:hypothetical protein [Pyrinomonadaceae bacterium]